MPRHRGYSIFLLSLVLLGLPAFPAYTQHKMSTAVAPDVATPDKVDTSIGTLHLSDGNPDIDTVNKIYDNLDESRALQAYLLAIPFVNQAGRSFRRSLLPPTIRP